jgi:diguanylate cyclase (GGDEF)-like protein
MRPEDSPPLGDQPDLANATSPIHEAEASPRYGKWLLPLLGLVFFLSLLAWSQLGGDLLSTSAFRISGAGLVVIAALYTLLVARRAGRRHVELERLYSEHLEKLSENLRHIAYHDSLTGLYNHRYFHEQLPYEFERAQRYGHRLSVIMLDVDHFKEVNDRYGHLTGDDLLAFLGKLVNENIRASDIAARYGGDEFALILPETDRSAARATADKLKDVISQRRDWGAGVLVDVALDVSAGVAEYPTDAASAEELLLQADRALYASRSRRGAARQAGIAKALRR